MNDSAHNDEPALRTNRMFPIKTLVASTFAVLVFIHGNPALGQVSYLEYEIPTAEGARNIQQEMSTEYSTITVSYSLEFQDDLDVLEIYNSFFRDKRWERLRMKLMQEYPDQFEGESAGDWDSWSIDETGYGMPRAFFGANWQNQLVNSEASVALEVTGYEAGWFGGRVTVTIAPDIQPPGTTALNQWFRAKPEDLFILYDGLGHSPFRFDLVDRERLEALRPKGEAFETYYGIVESTLDQFRSWQPYGG